MTLRWLKVTGCPNVPDCDCPEPPSPPVFAGQTAWTDCGGSPSSGSSASSEPSSPSDGSLSSGSSGESSSGDSSDSSQVSSSSGGSAASGSSVTPGNCAVTPTCFFSWSGYSWSGSDETSLCRENRPPGQQCGCDEPTGSGDFIGDSRTTQCYAID